jgi:sugar lactone lactonase YvrE
VDVDGGLWVAVWGRGQVRHYTDTGVLEETLTLPVDRPTAPALVDDLLVVTTARDDLTPPASPMALLDPSPAGQLYAYRLAS